MSKKPTREQILARARQAQALTERGNLMGAAVTLQPYIEHARDLPGVLDLYAGIRATQGHYAEAAECYRQILKGQHGAIEVRQKLAMCLRRCGRFDEAIQQIERIRETEPWNIVAVLSLVDTYATLNMKDAALALLDELETHADTASIGEAERARIAIIRMRLVDDESLAGEALAMATKTTLTPGTRSSLATHAGIIYQKKNRVDDAFAALSAGKVYRELIFDAEVHAARITEAIDFWNSDAARALPRASVDGSRFVFVVGMPRSGTSLLEQMLGRLRGVAPLGERSEMIRLAAGLCPPKARHLDPLVTSGERITQENLDTIMPRILESYQEAAERYAPASEDRAVWVDKQVYNFSHLPVIARTLPGAKVLHIRRNACDTALSCFSQWFNNQHHFTKDMASLGAYYKQYRRLTDAWADLPAPEMRPETMDVSYEALVSDPEGTIRPVLAFLGLEYDEAVLSPESSDRVVLTASRDQVRRSINAGAVGRWRAYERHMAPFLEAIGPELAAEATASQQIHTP